MRIYCNRCGHLIGAIFVRESDPLFPTDGTADGNLLCRQCRERKRTRQGGVLLICIAVLVLLGIFLVTENPASSAGWILLNLAVFYLFSLLLIIPHELGHVAAAQLLKMRIYSIEIGVGPILLNGKRGITRWQVKAVPNGGRVFAVLPDLRFSRRKMFVMIAAGPLLPVLIALGVMAAGENYFSSGNFSFEGLYLGFDFLFAVGVHTAINLWPRTVAASGGPTANDGGQLLALLRSNTRTDSQERLRRFLVTDEALKSGDVETAERACLQLRQIDPQDPNAIYNLAFVRMAVGRYSESRALLSDLLQHEEMSEEDRNELRNTLAYFSLLTGIDECLREGLTMSSELVRKDPDDPLYKGTYGFALIVNGEVEEGIALLRALPDVSVAQPQLQGIRRMMMAVAARKQGNDDECSNYVREARRLAQGYPFLDVIERSFLSR